MVHGEPRELFNTERYDTPADFKPKAEYLVAATIMVERTLVSFLTTDNLSGIDHYEVGVIDKSQPATESPVFLAPKVLTSSAHWSQVTPRNCAGS